MWSEGKYVLLYDMEIVEGAGSFDTKEAAIEYAKSIARESPSYQDTPYTQVGFLKRITERDVAKILVDHAVDGFFEEDLSENLDISNEEPLLEWNDKIRNDFEITISEFIIRHKMLVPYYSIVNVEPIGDI